MSSHAAAATTCIVSHMSDRLSMHPFQRSIMVSTISDRTGFCIMDVQICPKKSDIWVHMRAHHSGTAWNTAIRLSHACGIVVVKKRTMTFHAVLNASCKMCIRDRALTGNIGAADIRKGKKGYSTDPKKIITGTMAEQAAQTITPGTANKPIAANRFLTGVQTISGDKNLIGANIIRGQTIFGVAGEAIYAGDIAGYLSLIHIWQVPAPFELEICGYCENPVVILHQNGKEAARVKFPTVLQADEKIRYSSCLLYTSRFV